MKIFAVTLLIAVSAVTSTSLASQKFCFKAYAKSMTLGGGSNTNFYNVAKNALGGSSGTQNGAPVLKNR